MLVEKREEGGKGVPVTSSAWRRRMAASVASESSAVELMCVWTHKCLKRSRAMSFSRASVSVQPWFEVICIGNTWAAGQGGREGFTF